MIEAMGHAAGYGLLAVAAAVVIVGLVHRPVRRRFWWVPLCAVVVLLDWARLAPALPGDPRDMKVRMILAGGALASVLATVLVGKLQRLEQRAGLTNEEAWRPTSMSRQWWVAAGLWVVLPAGTVASAAVACWVAVLAYDLIAPTVGWEPLMESVSRFRPALQAETGGAALGLIIVIALGLWLEGQTGLLSRVIDVLTAAVAK